MRSDELPPTGNRITRIVGDDSEAPEDPVGLAVAEVLVDLLDGIVVELSYARAPHVPRSDTEPQAKTAVAERDGPGPWATRLTASVGGGAAGLCAEGAGVPRLPEMLADLPVAAFRAAEAIGRQSGVDGNVVTAPIHRALQDSVVIEIIAGELARLSEGTVSAADVRELVTETIAEFERIASTTVEGEVLTHGVVVRPGPSEHATRHRYPEEYRQKRVPLLFDGRNAVLVVDSDGRAVQEVQRSRPERGLSESELEAVREFTEQFGDLDGSLVAAVSKAFGALGFYVHPDHSIWVTSQGPPFLVKRGGRWRAVPSAALAAGIGQLVGAHDTGGTVVETAVLLSLHGHGGIIAVVESAGDIEDCVRAKDRVDDVQDGTAEAAVHHIVDVGDLDAATLLRLASIDGATVLDRSGRLLAYGAVVTSAGSRSEGARTAAARTLSNHADVVLKVSQDGPITVFVGGDEAGQLLA